VFAGGECRRATARQPAQDAQAQKVLDAEIPNGALQLRHINGRWG
jgi:hypothetical protein